MSAELSVALISAAAAVLAAVVTVVVSARTARVTAELQDKLEWRHHQASKEELLEQVMSRYREPLLRAAFDLQSRIYNIVKPRIGAVGLMTGSVAAGFGGGFAIDLPVLGTLVGTLVGVGLAAFVVARSSGGISARRTDPAT